MPIYDLHCKACDQTSESLILPNEPIECPKCRAREVDRLPAVSNHTWKRGHEADNCKKPWAGKQSKREG